MSSRSTNGVNASTDRQNSITKDFKSIKKAFSVIFHRDTSNAENASNATEMLEFIPHDVSDISVEIPTIQEKAPFWKRKFRCHCNENESERNMGYLMISNPESDPILISDHQATRNAQSCVQINETPFDPEQIQYSSITPFESVISTQEIPSSVQYVSTYDDLEAQQTRSSAECAAPHGDLVDAHLVAQISKVTSPQSTNSSDHEYTGIDRSQLNDEEYVRAQEMDLHQLYNLEIDLTKELNALECEIEYELQIAEEYESAVKLNANLKEQLRLLQENDPNHSPWACDLCTYINQPFANTKSDICDMCEGPSPMKQAALIK